MRGGVFCPFFWCVRLPLGSSSASYANSDIEGTTVILGNGYFSGFSFNARQAPSWSLSGFDSKRLVVCLLDLQSTILNWLPTVLCRIMPNLRWRFKLVFISFHSTHRINMNWFWTSVWTRGKIEVFKHLFYFNEQETTDFHHLASLFCCMAMGTGGGQRNCLFGNSLRPCFGAKLRPCGTFF